MKKLRFLILTILTCLLGLFAVACNQTIDFDYNIDFVVDGEVIATVGTDGDKIAMPKNPTKEDYAFDGWYWEEDGNGGKFTLNSILDQPLQEENHYKVYAHFKSTVYYTVIFDGGGEEIEQKIKYGEPTALRLNTFQNDDADMVFDFWVSISDNYQDGETVLNLCEAGEEIRLYARWKVDYGSYVVRFNPNGGTGNMPNQTVKRRASVRLAKNTFTRPHYEFDCWNTQQNGNGQTIMDEEKVYNLCEKNGAVTLYAQWKYVDDYVSDEPIYGATCIVRYMETNGGEQLLYEKELRVCESEVIHCLAYTAPANHVFVGWNTKANGTGTLYKNGMYVYFTEENAVVTLYAQYKKVGGDQADGVHYIEDYTDLANMKNDLDGTYVLTKNIDLPSDTRWCDGYVCGTPSTPFNGIFCGNGYTVSGTLLATSYGERYCGLFGYIGENGLVQDLCLDLWVTSWEYSAPFARVNEGTIKNCKSMGEISADENEFQSRDLYAGGIVVFNEGTIENTFSGAFLSSTVLTKSVRIGGICVRNTGMVAGCVYVFKTEYGHLGGYKYNDACSYQMDALICENVGVVTNNYYYDDMNYAVEKGWYDDEEPSDIVYASGKLTSEHGTGVTLSDLHKESFYVDTLGWNEDVWDFSRVNYDYDLYPILKRQ